MARINTVHLANQVYDTALRADFVRKDPAVIQAAKLAQADVRQAGNSTSALVQEVAQSWRRAGSGGATALVSVA